MGLKRISNYKLEIGTETTLTRSIKKPSVTGGFSHARKMVGVLIVTIVAAMSIFAGVTIAPSFNDGKANANLFVDWFCVSKGGPESWLGGRSGEIKSGLAQGAGQAPFEGTWAVAGFPEADKEAIQAGKEPTQKWTTLERFGYLAPSYSSWSGMAAYNDKIGGEKGTPWLGTGGDATGKITGTPVLIKNAKNSLLFTTNPLDCGGFSGSQAVGNAISFFPKAAVALSSNLYIASQNLSLTDKNSSLKPVGDVMEVLIVGDGKTKGLKDLLFMDFMVTMIVLGAIGIGVQGIIKGQGIAAMQSVAWMVGAAIGGILFMSNPLIISTVMESGINQVQSGIQKAVLQTSTSTPECSVGGNSGQDLHREITCTIWFSTIYKPWVEGQFGLTYDQMKSAEMKTDPSLTSAGAESPTMAVAAGEADDFFKDVQMTHTNITYSGSGVNRSPKVNIESVEDLNINTGVSSTDSRGVFDKAAKTVKLGNTELSDDMKNWAYLHMASQTEWPKSQGLNLSEVAYNQLVINNNEGWKHASNAPGSAFMSMLAATGPVIFLTVIAGTLISFQIVLVFLIVLAPFFLTVGIIPGWGKRVVMRWLEMLASLFIKRIILMTFLLIFMKIYISIMAFEGMNWFIQTLFVIILTIVALAQKDQVTDMITSQINFGSNMAHGDEREMKAAMVGGALVGVAAGRATARGTWKAGSAGVGGAVNRFKGRKARKQARADKREEKQQERADKQQQRNEQNGPEGTTEPRPKRWAAATAFAAGAGATLAQRAGVAREKWGDFKQRVKLSRSEAAKARELRAIAARRKEALAKKQRLRDMPEGPEKQQQRKELSDDSKQRRAARTAAIEAEREKRKADGKQSQAPQAAANQAASESRAQGVRDRKEQEAREAAARQRKRERAKEKKREAQQEGLGTTSPVAPKRSVNDPGSVATPGSTPPVAPRISPGRGPGGGNSPKGGANPIGNTGSPVGGSKGGSGPKTPPPTSPMKPR